MLYLFLGGITCSHHRTFHGFGGVFTHLYLLLNTGANCCAPGLTQLPDQGYRLYLESLFDEIGQEVGIAQP